MLNKTKKSNIISIFSNKNGANRLHHPKLSKNIMFCKTKHIFHLINSSSWQLTGYFGGLKKIINKIKLKHIESLKTNIKYLTKFIKFIPFVNFKRTLHKAIQVFFRLFFVMIFSITFLIFPFLIIIIIDYPYHQNLFLVFFAFIVLMITFPSIIETNLTPMYSRLFLLTNTVFLIRLLDSIRVTQAYKHDMGVFMLLTSWVIFVSAPFIVDKFVTIHKKNTIKAYPRKLKNRFENWTIPFIYKLWFYLFQFVVMGVIYFHTGMVFYFNLGWTPIIIVIMGCSFIKMVIILYLFSQMTEVITDDAFCELQQRMLLLFWLVSLTTVGGFFIVAGSNFSNPFLFFIFKLNVLEFILSLFGFFIDIVIDREEL